MKKYIIALLLAVFVINAQANTNNFQETYQELAEGNPELILYVNLEHDFLTLGNGLTRIYNAVLKANPDMMPIPVDFSKLMGHFGLTGLEHMLMASSWSDNHETFLNQAVIQLTENPEGLFKLLGTDNMEFSFAERVPANADVLMEMQFRPMALVDIARKIMIDTMGPTGKALLDGQLNQPMTQDGLTGLDLIQMLDTEIYFAQNVDPVRMENIDDENMSLSDYMGDQVWLIKDAGRLPEILAPFLAQYNFRTVPDDPYDAYIIETPWTLNEKLTWVFSKLPDSGDLLVSNNLDARDWFLAGGESLATNEDFQSMAAAFPDKGLSFWYASENAAQQTQKQMTAAFKQGFQEAVEESGHNAPDLQPFLNIFQDAIKRFSGKNAGVAYSSDNQLRFKSLQPYSSKTTLALSTLAVPGALTTAMAIPAFQKVRATSQEKAITNNLRQIASAAQQYMLETGESQVSVKELIGPNGFFDDIQSVAGESYDDIVISIKDTEISVTLPDGQVISYSF